VEGRLWVCGRLREKGCHSCLSFPPRATQLLSSRSHGLPDAGSPRLWSVPKRSGSYFSDVIGALRMQPPM
jgi:hypothetical protein